MQTTRSLLTVDPSALSISSKRKRDAKISNVRHQAEDNSNSKVAKTSDTTSKREEGGDLYSMPPIAAIRGDDNGSQTGGNKGHSAAHASSASGAAAYQHVSDDGSSIDPVAAVTNDVPSGQRASQTNCTSATASASHDPTTVRQAEDSDDAKLASMSTQGGRAVAQQAADGKIVAVPSSSDQQLEDNKLAAAPLSTSTMDTTRAGSQQAVTSVDGNTPAVVSSTGQAVRHSAEGNQPAAAAFTNDATQGKADSAAQNSLQFYQISLVQMQAGCFPLPMQLRNGQSILPINFVASHDTGEALCHVDHSVRWFTLMQHSYKHQTVRMEVLQRQSNVTVCL